MDSKLAELLHKYPVIWDRSRKDFRDNNKKQNTFKALASELNTSGKITVLCLQTFYSVFTNTLMFFQLMLLWRGTRPFAKNTARKKVESRKQQNRVQEQTMWTDGSYWKLSLFSMALCFKESR